MPEPGFLRAVEVLTDALLTPQEFARHKPSPDQMTLRWVTIHPHGEGEESRRIQINTETGEIEKGFGAGKTMHEAFSPKSETLATSETQSSTPGRKWYGMTYRPPALGAIPKGEYEHKPHPDFRHGQISYNEPLSQEMQDAYELTPIHEDGDIPAVAKSVGAAMGKYAGEYAKPQNAQLLDDQLSLERIRKLLGHVDKEKLKAEFRKQFGQESDADRIESEASSIADGVQKQKQRSMIYQADDKERLAEKHGKPLDAYHDLPFDDWMKLRAADDESGREPQKPDDAILSKYPSLAEPPKQAEMSEMVRAAAGYQLHGMRNEPEDRAAWREHSQHMTKSALDGWLMKKFGIDSATARAVSNAAGDMNPFTTEGAGTVGGQGVKWNHDSPEPTMEELGDMPWLKSDAAAENSIQHNRESLSSMRSGMKAKIAELEAKEASETKRLTAEKSRAKGAEKKDAIDDQWRAMKDDLSKQRQAVMQSHLKEIESHPEYQQEKAESSRKAKGRQDASQAEDKARASDADKANWDHIQSNGGYEAVRDSLTADIKSLKSRLAKTKDANKWKLESNLANRERDLERVNALNEKYGSKQPAVPPEIAAKYPSLAEDVGAKPEAAKEPWEMTRDEFMRQSAAKPASGGFAARANAKIAKPYHRQLVTQAVADGKSVPPEVLADYPELSGDPEKSGQVSSSPEKSADERKPFKPEGVPGEQMGLFDQDAGGQKSLFNVVKPDKKSKKAPAAAPSELEKIRDEHNARSEESAPLPGQKSIRGLATKPKNTAEADEKIASQKMASDFLQESRDEKEQAKRKERVSQWRSGFTGSPKENNASGDIARHDWEKALQNGVSPKRLSEMVDSAVQAGALDAGVGKHLKSRFSIEDQYPSLKGFSDHQNLKPMYAPSDEKTKAGEEYRTALAGAGKFHASRVAAAEAGVKAGHTLDEMLQDLKDEGVHEFDAKRIIGDAFNKAGKPVTRSDQPKPRPSDDDWKPENHVKIAADDISKLRKQDVHRLMENATGDRRAKMADYIRQNRPELAGEVQDSLDDLGGDSSASKDSPSVYEIRVKGQDGNPTTKHAVAMRGKPGFGDSVFNSREEAESHIKKTGEINRLNAEYQAKQDVIRKTEQEKEHAEKTERESIDGFANDRSPRDKANIIKTLNAKASFDGKVMSVKDKVRDLVANGESLSADEENKIKPMTRTQFNRADGREQDAHEKRMREGGKKTVYRIGGYDLGKTAYDYAKHLLSQGKKEFSRRAPHEELIHHLHEAMNHDGKCCYEKEEGEDDIADHVPADHRHMDKSVHELCRHLGASHPELQAAYENYTAAVE
jgi:hypothetical protein